MPKAYELEQALFDWAPRRIAEDWDNNGLLCGRAEKEVSTVLVALDPFEDVAEEAIRLRADAIVTHHPLIFRPLPAVSDRTSIGRTILTLAAHDIVAINAHTNLDCAVGGVNEVLAQRLGLTDVRVIGPEKLDGEARTCGLLRAGYVKETSLTGFAAFVKETLGCPGLRFADGGRPVRCVAVGGGACASELLDAADAGCDTFVTADVKYNQFWDAHDLGVNLIDAGHFYTEDPVCDALADYLRARFPSLRVIRSSMHRDVMQFL